ncbi:MAG: ATP-dependent metalloprotease, partial [Gammaproteobacteria bacterium]
DALDKLDIMANALMKFETIDEAQLGDIMEGREPREPEDWDSQPPPAAPAGDAGLDKKDEPSVGGPAQQH